ncbi:hypothetical protein [Streptomyces sp. NPDC046821]
MTVAEIDALLYLRPRRVRPGTPAGGSALICCSTPPAAAPADVVLDV